MEQQIEQIIQQLASQIEAAQIHLNLLQSAAISQPTTSEPDPKNSPADCPAFEIDLFSKNTKSSNQREDFKEISGEGQRERGLERRWISKLLRMQLFR
jgi:hypothetical protein